MTPTDKEEEQLEKAREKVKRLNKEHKRLKERE